MLLVDHDQAQARQRCKHGEARTDDDVGSASLGVKKAAHARGIGHAAVQLRHRSIREAGRHRAHKRR